MNKYEIAVVVTAGLSLLAVVRWLYRWLNRPRTTEDTKPKARTNADWPEDIDGRKARALYLCRMGELPLVTVIRDSVPVTFALSQDYHEWFEIPKEKQTLILLSQRVLDYRPNFKPSKQGCVNRIAKTDSHSMDARRRDGGDKDYWVTERNQMVLHMLRTYGPDDTRTWVSAVLAHDRREAFNHLINAFSMKGKLRDKPQQTNGLGEGYDLEE